MDHQAPASSKTEALTEAQHNFERRFSCPVCLDPKLKMVVSSCQHRTCCDCLYDETGTLHKGMRKCPTCQQENAYPVVRPDIPEDSIVIQRQLGVTECPMDGCKAGLWMWDVEKHIESCPHAVVSPKPTTKTKKAGKRTPKQDKGTNTQTNTNSGRKRALSQDENTKSPPAAKQPKRAQLLPTVKPGAPNDVAAQVVTRNSSSSCTSARKAQELSRYPLRQTYVRVKTSL